ncbi:YggT family protein [Clostridium sp. MSJ-11]|uniref:YggT family protein n=1 Tax=Clostridium mobile TaxID=2841512 RepID=A0ABS6EDW5_9CLOT|nr:YggT family protein [Clostridium mobile]MBU5482977.1 YggT family protein [Clostridium mobile]
MRGISYRIIVNFFNIVEWAILIDVILSFIPMNNNFTQILRTITEPLLIPGRRIQERLLPGLMIDFSPVFALLMINLLEKLLLSIIL